ncbi:hypothetical protein NDU88_005588 [Pleurodeles waltl]|uniref:Uncharacterized protein n=1 Tax=Pleurodeles waltl TaxID=8319 RepID=A0AAV7MF23_PLEWA|nr:hypothetical protein NDU88_005588 [Pleurodeles waltl]
MGPVRFSLRVAVSALPQRPTLSSPSEASGLPAVRALPRPGHDIRPVALPGVPLQSSRSTRRSGQPGGPGPGLQPPRQHTNHQGPRGAPQPARQVRTRRKSSGSASRSSQQPPTSAGQQGAAAHRGPVRARPPATPGSTPKAIRGHLRVPKRRLAAPHRGLYLPQHGLVYWLTGGIDSGRILAPTEPQDYASAMLVQLATPQNAIYPTKGQM